MPVSKSYLDFVLDQLAALNALSARRMFGGIGLYQRESLFGLIDDDMLYFRVGDSSRGEYARRAMPAFRPVASKPELVSKNYFQVPAEVLEDADELAQWAQRAVRAARTKAKTKAKARATSKNRGQR